MGHCVSVWYIRFKQNKYSQQRENEPKMMYGLCESHSKIRLDFRNNTRNYTQSRQMQMHKKKSLADRQLISKTSL